MDEIERIQIIYSELQAHDKRKIREGVLSCIGPDGFDLNQLRSRFDFPSDSHQWSSVLEDCLFHLSTELILPQSERAAYSLHRLLEAFGDHPYPTSVSLSSFGSVCRATHPSYPGIIDKFLAITGVDPYGTIREWPCVCSSTCYLAQKMCMGKIPVELAVHAMNHTALQQIYLSIPDRLIDSRLLAPIFRQNHRFPTEQVLRVTDVLQTFFPVSDNFEIFSAAKLLAILEDGRAGVISSLPIEQIGLYGRTARALLPNLVSLDGSSSLLFLLAGTKHTVAGRDIIFRFLLDMRLSPEPSMLEFAVRENPSFWLSQSPSGSSPALAIEGKLPIPASVFRHYFHLRECREKCACKICVGWNQEPECFQQFHAWMISHNRVDDYVTFNGYEMIHNLSLGRQEEARKIVETKADVKVTGFEGNTAMHLAQDVDLLRVLVQHGAEFNSTNIQGKTPLDFAVMKNNTYKVKFLLEECHSKISVVSLGRICSLIEGNRELLNVFRQSLKSLVIETPNPNAVTQVAILKQELDNEIQYCKRKIDKLRKEHQTKLDDATLESQKKFDESAKAFRLSLKAANDQLRDSSSKISQLEELLGVANKEKLALESDKEILREKLHKLEKSKSKEAAKREADRQQLEVEREARECTLCMEHPWDTALMCGHCYCGTCIKAACSEKCPTCSKRTTGKFIKLFNCRK